MRRKDRECAGVNGAFVGTRYVKLGQKSREKVLWWGRFRILFLVGGESVGCWHVGTSPAAHQWDMRNAACIQGSSRDIGISSPKPHPTSFTGCLELTALLLSTLPTPIDSVAVIS